jgi:KDO2-lipid IV(A) lauroyltransferase
MVELKLTALHSDHLSSPCTNFIDYMKNLKFLMMAALATPFGLLPLHWSQTIGSYLGKLAVKINKKRKHIITCNLSACFPEKSEDERIGLLQKTAEEAGKWFMESAYVWFKNPEFLAKKTSVKNPEVLKTAFDKQKGVIIILPHLGNWEILNFYVPQNYPFGAMYKPIKSELIEEMIFKGRSRVGTSMFSADARGARKAFKHLKKGGVLAILSDHLPSVKAGVYAPFFGINAYTGKLTHSLAKYNESEILLATVLRKAEGQGFEIEFHPVDGMNTNDEIVAATNMNAAIEKGIRLAPEQYQWAYRRFSRQPKGVKNIYGKKSR